MDGAVAVLVACGGTLQLASQSSEVKGPRNSCQSVSCRPARLFNVAERCRCIESESEWSVEPTILRAFSQGEFGASGRERFFVVGQRQRLCSGRQQGPMCRQTIKHDQKDERRLSFPFAVIHLSAR